MPKTVSLATVTFVSLTFTRQRDSDMLEEGGLLLVGLANGKVAMFPVSEFLKVYGNYFF